MKRCTDVVVGKAVEKAVERVLDRWACGDTRMQTEIYVAKLRLTAKHLRNEAQGIADIDVIVDQSHVRPKGDYHEVTERCGYWPHDWRPSVWAGKRRCASSVR